MKQFRVRGSEFDAEGLIIDVTPTTRIGRCCGNRDDFTQAPGSARAARGSRYAQSGIYECAAVPRWTLAAGDGRRRDEGSAKRKRLTPA